MGIKREGWIFLLVVFLVFILVTILAPLTYYSDPLNLAIRLCALYGFVALAFATAMTPFLKEITQAFGRPFIRIHHILAIFGIIFVTLHPVFFAISQSNLAVFIPRFDSWQIFWELAGRPALYILYIAAIAALLRAMIGKYWRYFHWLMYIVLFFVIVHGPERIEPQRSQRTQRFLFFVAQFGSFHLLLGVLCALCLQRLRFKMPSS